MPGTPMPGTPTLVVFDEAWSFFSHELFIGRIRSWLKEGRKNNVGVLMATQSLSDAIRSELTAELMESCPTKIFLPNIQAETKSSAEQYRALGLSEPEITQIARMRPKRDYYLTQPQGRRVLSFPIGHLGLSIVGRTSARDSRRALASGNNRGGRPHPDIWKEGIADAFAKMGAAANSRQTRRQQEDPPARGPEKTTVDQRPDEEDKVTETVATRSDGARKSTTGESGPDGKEAKDDARKAAG